MTSRASDRVTIDVAKTSRRGSLLWIQGLGCGALLTFAAPTAMLLLTLFAPTIICLLAETGSRTGLVRAVGLGCGAASIGPVWRLWLGGESMDLAFAMLCNPATLLLAWGCGAASWALCQVFPVVLRSLWDVRDARRSRAIEAELAQLRAAWSLEET